MRGRTRRCSDVIALNGFEVRSQTAARQQHLEIRKSEHTFCASLGGSILDLTIFKATVVLPRCSCPSSFARWQMAKPPFPSCGPVSYCNPSGSRTTSGGASACTEGADIWVWEGEAERRCRSLRSVELSTSKHSVAMSPTPDAVSLAASEGNRNSLRLPSDVQPTLNSLHKSIIMLSQCN